LAAYLTPPLTTVHQPKDELGKLAVDKLLRRMDDADAPSDLLVLTPVLVDRGSVIAR
ncbi:substrate-binding domain-containing protein, partial [Morganella psychrotolerans]